MIDLSLSEQQQEIVDSAVDVLSEQCPAARLRPGSKAVDVHPLLAHWGWFGVGLPEEMGGSGLGVVEETLLYIEAGRYLLPPSVLATTLAAGSVDEDLREALLDGRQRAAMILTAEDNWAYCFDRGDVQCLVAIDSDTISTFPRSAFAGQPVSGLDETVVLEKGTLDVEQRVAVELGHRGMLLTAAMLVGVAKASCELAVEYAKVREQFGQPIGSFQAIKHRCADMAINAYAGEAQILMAAAASVDDIRNAPFQIAVAAQIAIKAAQENGVSAVQVHGGMGYTAECDAHLFLKRAHLLGALIGGLQKQRAWLLSCPAPE